MSIPKACSNSATTPAVWLVGEGSKQPVEPVLQQGLSRRHAAHLIQAELQAVLADAEHVGYICDGNRFLDVQPEGLPGPGDNLHHEAPFMKTRFRW